MYGDGIMKELIKERIKKYVDNDIPIIVIFYTNIECGGQYGGLYFDSKKSSIEMNDDYVWIYSDNFESIVKWSNIICIHIEIL